MAFKFFLGEGTDSKLCVYMMNSPSMIIDLELINLLPFIFDILFALIHNGYY